MSYLLDIDDFSVGLLDLLQLADEVPETRLGNNMILGKNPHAVYGRLGVAFGGQTAANHHIFSVFSVEL